MKFKLISVIVPVYNLEKYIEKCIVSIVSQTYQDWELLLIDDGSKDKSLQICQAWAKKDKRIKVFHQENQGVSAARNLGLSVVQGEYLVFVDGDDWLDNDCFQIMMEQMRDDVQMVCCDFCVEREENCQHDVFFHKEETGIQPQDVCIADYYGKLLYTKTIWAKIYRTNLWDGIRFEKLKNYEDRLAIFEIIKRVHQVSFVKSPFYHYLQRTSSASHLVDENYYRDVLYVLDLSFVYACNQKLSYKQEAGALYIDMAYSLLKLYENNKKKEEARTLIWHMKEIYQKAELKNPSRAQKLLLLPTQIVYALVGLKRVLKG